MSLKNQIVPMYFQYDILDTEMPAAFFDHTAKTNMYFYELNQGISKIDIDTLFVEEDNLVQQNFEMNFYGNVDCWLGTNYSKFTTPFHSDNLAKTIAYQTEIRMFIIDKKIFEKIKNNFCIFTFEPLSRDPGQNKKIQKYIIKEINEFKDRIKVRYAEVKLLQLNSNLIKSSQNWTFITSVDFKRKVKQIKITLPFESAIGEIKIKGFYKNENNPMGGINAVERNLDYNIVRVTHPFEKLEPICFNFVKNDDKLLVQAVNWDQLGNAFSWLANKSFGPTNKHKYGPVDENDVEGSVGMAGYSYFIDECRGIADFYCGGESCKNANNVDTSLKAYFWNTTNINALIKYWHCFYVGKTMPSWISYDKLKRFFTNTDNVYPANWKGGYGGHDIGDKFSEFTLITLNQDNFITNDKLLNLDEIKNPTWLLTGNMELKHIFNLYTHYDGKAGYYGLFKNDMKLPWGLMNKDQWKNKIAKCKNSAYWDDIQIIFELPNVDSGGCYLSEISLIILFASTIKITLYDELGLITDYYFDTNFYRANETDILTRIRFN